MAALDYLRRAGLAVDLEGDRLRVAPADRITADVRQFVRAHRAELLADLLAERAAANDPRAVAEAPPAPAAPAPKPIPAPAAEAASEPRRNAWTVTRNGAPICRMVGQPMTRTEALATARWRWPDADILET